MAVYTQLSADELAGFLATYEVGSLVSAKGIAEGVSNSNWLVETSGSGPDGEGARFILTMFERRIDSGDLPFFLGLLDHLADRGCAVPRTIHDRQGASVRELAGKSATLIEFLPGVSPGIATSEQARAVGAELARIHMAARNYPRTRANALDPDWSSATLAQCGVRALAQIDPQLPDVLAVAAEIARDWPPGLPQSVIHSDLFPDNVLMLGARVSGLIDFYFACNGAMAYDLAVTHAAWCFDGDGIQFNPAASTALIEGYQTVRPLETEEKNALPLLAQGACTRFIASRAQDWVETPPQAMVMRKDPVAFLHRLRFYQQKGQQVFG